MSVRVLGESVKFRNEDLLEEILGRIAEAVFVVDKNGDILYANRAAHEGRGYTKTEFLKLNVKDINLPERADFVKEKISEVQKKGQATFETTHVRKDGSTFPVEIVSRMIKHGGVKGMIAVARDISNRLAEKEKLEASEEKYRTLFEDSQLAIFKTNATGGLDVANKAMARMFGYDTPEELIGTVPNVGVLYANPEERAELHKILSKKDVLEDYEVELRKRDGRKFWASVNVHGVRGNDGKIHGLEGQAIDINAKRLAEQALRESEERYRSIFENTTVAVIQTRVDGSISSGNPAFASMLGYDSVDELKRAVSNVRDIYINPQQRDRLIAILNAEGVANDYPIELQRRDGSICSLSVNVRAIKDSGGKTVVLEGLLVDVTARRQAEAELNESLKKLRTTIRAIPDLLFEIDASGRFLTYHASDKTSLYAPPEKFINKRITEIMPASVADVVMQAVARAAKSGSDYGVVYSLDMPSGRRWFELSIVVETEKNRKPDRFLAVARDITDIYQARKELKESYNRLALVVEGIVKALATTVETRDPYTAGHQKRVSQLAVAIARLMGWDEAKILGLEMASTIHDIGKNYVPTEILNKPGRLKPIEFELIKMHSAAGFDIIKDIAFDEPVAAMVRQHHERLNGSGYPDGLSSKDILPGAKIMAVADVVEAMSSDRPYRPGRGLNAALREVQNKKDELYDSEAVAACVELFVKDKFTFD